MHRINFDTTNVSSPDELHEMLKRQLGLPDYYGKNLDALWDCLTGWIKPPLSVEWRGLAESQQTLGDYADELLKTFRHAEDEVEGFKLEVV